MAGNRKKAIEVAVSMIDEIIPGGPSTEMTRQALEAMTDEQFDQFMQGLENGKIRLSIIATPGDEHAMSMERNIELGKKWGHSFTERLWITDRHTGTTYLSNEKYLILELPFRRQAQILSDKISIPKHSNTVDDLTGQATGASRGSRMSYPQIQLNVSNGLTNIVKEHMKYRGGDIEGFKAMNDEIMRTGKVRMADLDKMGTEVKVVSALSNYFLGMHIKSNLRG